VPVFTSTQLELQEAVRRMVETEVAPIAQSIDESEVFPMHLVEIFGAMGLIHLRVPEAYGGPGMDMTTTCLLKEEVAKVSASCASILSNNTISVVAPLMHFGNEEQRQRWLPDIVKNHCLSAIAITEPHAGSDVAAMRTRAIKKGGDYILNGQKCFITLVALAKYILVFAKTDSGGRRPVDNISCFMLDANMPGIRIGRREKTMGIRAVPHNDVHFDDVRIPADRLIGEEGKGFLAAMRVLDLNRPAVGAAATGLAMGALNRSLDYAKQRHAFGKPIAEFQGLQFMLADMSIQIDAARALLYDVTTRIDAGELDDVPQLASSVKCFASDVAMKVTTDAVQVLGGHGYIRDNHVERMMRDAKILQIYEGTNQIQRMIIARRALGLH
jgi:acyl-CoA dehydrogenase